GDHRLVDLADLAQLALALGALARGEVAQARLAAEQLASRGDFDPLGDRFLRLATCNGSRHGARNVAVALRLAISFCALSARRPPAPASHFFRQSLGESAERGGSVERVEAHVEQAVAARVL